MTERNPNQLGLSGFGDFVDPDPWPRWERELTREAPAETETSLSALIPTFTWHGTSRERDWSAVRAKSRFSTSIRHELRPEPTTGAIDLQALQAAIAAVIENHAAEPPTLDAEIMREVETRMPAHADRDRVELDVKYVSARLQHSLTRRQARNWLFSHNDALASRPIDALALGKTGAVIDAMGVVEELAY